LAADLVRRRVAVIAAIGGPPQALTARATNTTIPIVFQVGADPVEMGLVASLNRPGGNVTGVTSLNLEVGTKRLELMHVLLPTAPSMAVLVNPSNVTNTEGDSKALQAAAGALKLKLYVLHASADRDFDKAFATLAQQRVGALIIGPDPFLQSRAEQIAALATEHAIPTVTPYREFALAGGLASYGGDLAESWRQAGIYTGRVLKGEQPADLPVQQVTKLELIINLKTAKALGLTIPETLLATADEGSSEAQGVHRGAGWRGGVAAHGARAAARPSAAARRAHAVRRKRDRGEGPRLCVHASACRIGLDRWPQRRMDVRFAGLDTNRAGVQKRVLGREIRRGVLVPLRASCPLLHG
jgi:putative ABC transport system substrate-binding protein